MRRFFLWASIFFNLAFLGLFKYYNFFLDNFLTVFYLFGLELKAASLKIFLPVGISFYTFQTLSYSIDIYKKRLQPTKDFVAYAAFVSFFPQLMAGPIERAKNLLPQFFVKRRFKYNRVVDGLRQILWGLFKKVVIADNCAVYVDKVFENYDTYPGSILLLGAVLFTIQIYADFSGYSEMAIGTARLFGFDLMQNFAYPYFSRDFTEVWRRWHISLTNWFRDYLFIPMVKLSKRKLWRKVFSNLILFLVIGLWHGANWTFICWGLLMALYTIPNQFRKVKKRNFDTVSKGSKLPNTKELYQMIRTFGLIVFSMILFRSKNLESAFEFVSRMLSSFFHEFSLGNVGISHVLFAIVIIFFFGVEWVGRDKNHALEVFAERKSSFGRLGIYYSLIFMVLFFGAKQEKFLYFQF